MLRDNPISTEWSPELAYVIGLIASDGNLSSDGRHINITSKDEVMLQNVRLCLKIRNKIGLKSRGNLFEKKYFFLQFGSVNFYAFLLSLGLSPAKSKTLNSLKIPNIYFSHFLRGCIDGDGSITETIHPESTHLQLRVSICSGSISFLQWLHGKIRILFKVKGGWISTTISNRCSLLRFGKADSIKVLRQIYEDKDIHYLPRKFSVAEKYLD